MSRIYSICTIIEMNFLFYIYLLIVVTAFLCSLLSFKQHRPIYLKLFSVFIGITVITEIIANFLVDLFHLKSNYPVYNCFIIFQYLLLAYYFKMIISSTRTKKIINTFVIVFSI